MIIYQQHPDRQGNSYVLGQEHIHPTFAAPPLRHCCQELSRATNPAQAPVQTRHLHIPLHMGICDWPQGSEDLVCKTDVTVVKISYQGSVERNHNETHVNY